MKLDEIRLGKDKFSCKRCHTLQILLPKSKSGYAMDIYHQKRREIIDPPKIFTESPDMMLIQCINCGSSYQYDYSEILPYSDQDKIILNLENKIKILEKKLEIKNQECQKLATSLEKAVIRGKNASKESHNNENHQHYG